MGSRASQPLRNRQQVQDSSAAQVAPESFPSGDAVQGSPISNNNNNNNSNVNLNNDLDVSKIKEHLEQIGSQLRENGDNTNNKIEAQQSNGSSTISAKTSTLQRQASQIQSLAQRIRRSSSVRAPKLRSFLPAFMNNKRKVSSSSSCSICRHHRYLHHPARCVA